MKILVQAGKWLAASVGLVALAAVMTSVAAAAPTNAPTRAKAKSFVARGSEKTSFHFNNIPVRSALQLIAEEGRFNLVVSDSVQGNISLRLNDVTWEQALDLVLRIKGLQQHVERNTRSVTIAGG